jgi:hypothetical protein
MAVKPHKELINYKKTKTLCEIIHATPKKLRLKRGKHRENISA